MMYIFKILPVNRIRYKLIVVFILLIIGIFAVVLPIIYFSSVEIIKNQSVALNNKLVQLGANNLDASLEETDKIYQSMYINKDFKRFIDYRAQSSENGFIETYAGMRNLLHSYINSRKDIFSIVYFDAGYLVYVARNEAGYERVDENINLPEWFRDIAEKLKDKNIGRLILPTYRHIPLSFRITSSNEIVFSIARGIINVEKDFSPVGTLFINLDLSGFKKITEDIQPYPDSFTYILSEDGRVVYDSTGKNTSNTMERENLLRFAHQKGSTQIRLEGRDFVAVWSTSRITGWKIVNLIPVARYSANVAYVTRVIILICLLAAAVSIPITLYVSKRISNPIENLSDIMNRTNLGNMNIRADESRRDEIGMLSRSFNLLIAKLRNSIQKEYEAGIRQKDAELKALQAQINPHFLYNVLQSMSSIAVLNNVQEVNVMAKSLGKMLRYSISTEENTTTIDEEMEHVESYLSIQKIRFGEKLEYIIDVPEYMKKHRILRLSIQPIVENAVLHGFEDRPGKGIVYIRCYEQKDDIIFEISDNGRGIPDHMLESIRQELSIPGHVYFSNNAPSIGLKNVLERLRILYGGLAQMHIESEVDVGTCIHIRFPSKIPEGERL